MNIFRNKVILIFTVFVVSVSLTSVFMYFLKQQEIERNISSQVVRFHVRANSNSEEDQGIKLKVRDDVLRASEEILSDCETKEESITVLSNNLKYIEETAQKSVYENGSTEKVSAEIRKEIFPLKRYGSLVFPAGEYTALVIEIGSGKGRNWWCVMFPQLCFIDECMITEDENAREELSLILEEDEYNAVTGDGKIEVGFKIAEIIKDIF